MRFRVRHVTKFVYPEPVYESHNEVRLKPRDSGSQHTIGFHLEVRPNAAVVEYPDAFGNTVHALSIHAPHRELIVMADSLVECSEPPKADPPGNPSFAEFLAGDEMRAQEQYDFLHASRYIPFSEQLKRLFWMEHPKPDQPVGDYVQRLVAWVRDQFAYEPGSTNVHSDVNHVLTTGAGVCQDFAHLTIGLLRLAGVPARYTSGYLAPRGQSRPLGSQASHAWIEALIPERGWIGFDPTHGCEATDHHLRIAVGRDYADVPPLHGVYRGASSSHQMGVTLDISEDTGGNGAHPESIAKQQ
ncbi:MAG TPA: transglutaminase family protein [Candidatus Binataceae bacterium]|nr:transglutaminase family protein [Candidatus Binataceae bacterium]